VTYSAILNENAVVAGTGTNTNSAVLDYSNDPNSTGFGTSIPDESDIYTYDIDILKYDAKDSTKALLAGAVFALSETNVTEPNITPIVLVEVDPAAGDTYYRIATAAEIESLSTTPTADATEPTTMVRKTNTVTTNGTNQINIQGLQYGTYYLHETTPPTGFNAIQPTPVTITADTTDATPAILYDNVIYSFGGTKNKTADDNIINVANGAGTVLPPTGSIGTIGLTALGVGVIFGGVVFTSRKRKNNR
jgi:LPXTG-motif cell wall-anchored protein